MSFDLRWGMPDDRLLRGIGTLRRRLGSPMTENDRKTPEVRRAAGLRDLDDFASLVLKRVSERRIYVAAPVTQSNLADRLLEAAMQRSAEQPREVVASMLRAGISPEAVADLYIPEAARRMGREWENDTSGFASVSIGSSHLQTLLRELNDIWELGYSGIGTDARPVVVVMTVPGSQHVLGATVLTTQLRRLGCSVQRTAQLEEIDPREPCGAIFISASASDGADRVRSLIADLRSAMKSETPPIILGGALLEGLDDAARRTGADLATIDPLQALDHCNIARP